MIAALLVSAAFLLAPGEAAADDQAMLKKHYAKALELYKEKDYEGAMEAFVKARFYKTDWAFGVNIAKCLEKLERYGEAASEIALAIEQGKDKIPDDVRAGLEEKLAGLEEKVARLTIEGGLQENEHVYIDGQVATGITENGVVYLDPGKFEVEVKVGDQVLLSEKIELTQPGASQTLEIDREKEIVIDTGKKKEPGGLKDRWALWTGVALAAAGVGLDIGGIAQTVKIRNYDEDLNEARAHVMPTQDICACFSGDAPSDECFAGGYAPSDDYRDDVLNICDSKDSLLASEMALYIVGSTLAAAGITLIIVDLTVLDKKRKEKKSKVSLNLRPVFHVNSAGLFLEGRF